MLHQGTEAPFCGTLLNNKQDGHLRLPPVRAAAVQGGCEVRVGHRLAELLSAVRPGPHRGARRRQPRHDPHRDPLPALRRPSRPRVRRRPAADAQALLPELGVDGVLRGRGQEPEQQDCVGLKPGLRWSDDRIRPRLCGRGAGDRGDAVEHAHHHRRDHEGEMDDHVPHEHLPLLPSSDVVVGVSMKRRSR